MGISYEKVQKEVESSLQWANNVNEIVTEIHLMQTCTGCLFGHVPTVLVAVRKLITGPVGHLNAETALWILDGLSELVHNRGDQLEGNDVTDIAQVGVVALIATRFQRVES